VNKRELEIPWLVGGLLVGLAASAAPLLPHLAARLPGDPVQAAAALWHLWWPLFGLTSSDALSFGLPLTLYQGGPWLSNHLVTLPVLASIPFTLLRAISGNAVLSFNLTLLLGQVAAQGTLYGYLRARKAAAPLAALGSLAFALSPWMIDGLGAPDILRSGLWALPLALWLWDRLIDAPSPARAVFAGAAAWLALPAGLENTAWLWGLWLPYAVVTGWQALHAQPVDQRGALRDALLIAAGAFTLLALIYPAHALVRALQGAEPPFASANPDLLVQTPARSFLISLLRSAPAIWAAALAGLLLAREGDALRGRGWLALGAVNLLFAFGLLPAPARMFSGMLALPWLPTHSSLAYFGTAAFALLVFAVENLAPRWEGLSARWRWIAGGAALLLIGAGAAIGLRGFTTHPVSVPAFYTEIAAEPEDYFLLEVPFGLANTQDGGLTGSAEGAALVRYAAWHGKRTLSGAAYYFTPDQHARLAGLAWLFPQALGEDGIQAAAPDLAEAVNTWRFGYVIVHPDLLDAQALQAIDALAEHSEALCPAQHRDGLIIYRALWQPGGCGG